MSGFETITIEREGAVAAERWFSIQTCPYDAGTQPRRDWERGWRKANNRRAASQA